MTIRPSLLSILTLESVRDLFRPRAFPVLILLVLAGCCNHRSASKGASSPGICWR
jgi:hypothetical protein